MKRPRLWPVLWGAAAMVLAGTKDGVLAGCREHARRWVASDACRVAAESGGSNMIQALELWADENGSYVSLSAAPRNDIRRYAWGR